MKRLQNSRLSQNVLEKTVTYLSPAQIDVWKKKNQRKRTKGRIQKKKKREKYLV